MYGNDIRAAHHAEARELISLTDIRLSLQGASILRGVDLHMGDGEIYGLLGPNGAGKSTTISVISALRKPDGGTASVLGLNPVNHPAEIKGRIGVLAENAGFYDWMTGQEYLRWFAGLYGNNFTFGQANVLLSRVGLNGDSRPIIGRYSRGMKQRLGLARALVNDPDLLILDEPTSGLDPEGRHDIHDLLLELNRNKGIGILLTTHLLDDVERLCDRIGIIHRGKIILEGETAKLSNQRKMLESYQLRVGEPFPKDNEPLPPGVSVTKRDGDLIRVELVKGVPVESIWRILMAVGWNIIEIRREKWSLEEIYLAAVRKGEQDESTFAHHH